MKKPYIYRSNIHSKVDDGLEVKVATKGAHPPKLVSQQNPIAINASSTMDERKRADSDFLNAELLLHAVPLNSSLRLKENFTKAKGKSLWPSDKLPLSSLLCGAQQTTRISIPSSLIKVISVVSVILFLLYNFQTAEALTQSRCETYGWNAFPVWKYRARARHVPPLHMDPHMQQEFFRLFRGLTDDHDEDHDSSEEDSFEDAHHGYIPQLDFIAEMCPRDAFFYSLSPKHVRGIAALATMFVEQPSPPDVLRLAKAVLKTRRVHPKVWYHAIVGAAQERPDMTGFKLAHVVDAMPDLFIPGPLLFDAMHKYREGEWRSGLNMTENHHPFVKSRKIKKPATGIKRYKIKKVSKRRNRVRRSDSQKIARKQVQSSKNKRRRVKTLAKKKIEISQSANMSIATLDESEYRFKGVQPAQSEQGGRSLSHDHYHPHHNQLHDSVKKRKKSSKPEKIAKIKVKPEDDSEEPDYFKGNGSEYNPESGMNQRGRHDAFDKCIVVDSSLGVKNGIENQLAYWTNDMSLNSHHWYWHQEYPTNASMHRARRAELFYYMHRNLIARYNAERISNGMGFTKPFDIRPGAEIRTAYDSLLADVNSGKYWTPRPPHVRITDIIHEHDRDFEKNIILKDYNNLYGRLVRSIHVGHLLMDKLKTLNIHHTKGIEPLANTVEASELTVNPTFYDAVGFHNIGHQLIGLSADPYFKHQLPTGVMADTATTMRDPEFYSYHTLVDNLFDMYKKSLPPYKLHGGEYPLSWDGVEILDVEVISKHIGPKNQLRTFWNSRRFELTPGVDQSVHKGDVDLDVCAVHLDHEPFDFKITVAFDPCAKTHTNKGTVRIFLAPRYDEHGHRLPLKVQRRMMIHMDSFPVELRVGRNVLFRRSFDSSVGKPWSKSLEEYEKQNPVYQREADFCGCGWPHHLYIPKGSHEGTPFDLFVMITNYDHDEVEEDPKNLEIPEPCNSPYLYCGIPRRKYPDAKPMGYPFDRLPFSVPIHCSPGPVYTTLLCKILSIFWWKPVTTLEEYVGHIPNAIATVVEIKHFSHLVHW